jgi:hypothetical protein
MKYLFPNNKEYLQAGFILLSNTYSSIGEDKEAKEVRFNQLKELGKRNVVGISWTAPNGQLVV